MRMVRLVLCGGLGVLLLLPAAQAGADPLGKLPVRVQPARPTTTDTVTVIFRAQRLKPDERYEVSFGAFDATTCTAGYQVRLGRQRPGRLVRVRFSPNRSLASGRVLPDQYPLSAQNVPTNTRFCAGGTDALVMAVNADGGVRYLGKRTTGLKKDPAYPPLTATPVTVGLIPGSTVTVRRDGHPDRTLELTGQLGGSVPDPIQAAMIQRTGNTEIVGLGPSLTMPVIEPDTACAGPRYRAVFGVGRDASLLIRKTGEVTFTLPLEADPASLAGCNEPSASGRTLLTLSGAIQDGLSRIATSGTLTGVTIAPGVTADLIVNLVLRVDINLPLTPAR